MRGIWRQEWLGCLAAFADGSRQRQTWLDSTNTNPHWSYVEFMCCYFDDTLRGDTYDWALAEGFVTAQEVGIVSRLHQLLRRHNAPDDVDHAQILADPDWSELVAEAEKVRRGLLACLTESDERSVLNAH